MLQVMRSFIFVVLLMLVLGVGVVSAQEDAPDTVTVVEVIEEGGFDWSVIIALLETIGKFAAGGAVLFVLYRSAPADFSAKMLESVERLIEDIADFQRKAEETPTPVDDVVGYLARFGAEQLRAALERKAQAQGADHVDFG